MRTENNSVVLVTGADGNLGRAVSQAFAGMGADLVLVGRHLQPLQAAFGADTPTQLLVAADLTQADAAQSTMDQALKKFGRIDVVCNLAGGFRMGAPVHETSGQDWDFLFDLNCRALLNTVRAAVPPMLQQGRGKIVNVGAFAAGRGAPYMGAYTASKSAVARLTESMAAELREKGINVNCVLPTIIDTPENRVAMPDADPARWVAPADLAEVILFLASDKAKAIHGASLPVTGLS